jgi:uncharacterized protein YheU (UPF0270 family)
MPDYNADPYFKEQYCDDEGFLLPRFLYSHGKVWQDGKIVVPEKRILDVISLHHSSLLAGHWGVFKTRDLIARQFLIPRLRERVTQFIRTCDVCQRVKPNRHPNKGILQQLRVPTRRWTAVSIDWVEGLQESVQGNDSIMVVVDRATKYVHLFPTSTKQTAEEFATLFLNGIVKYHGLPSEVTSDRDHRVINDYWKALCAKVGIRHQPTTAYRPQANGQVERVNQSVGQLLRVATMQGISWEEAIPQLEIALNNAALSNSDITPYFLTYGFHPAFLSDLPRQPGDNENTPNENVENFVLRMQTIYENFARILQTEQQRISARANQGKKITLYEEGSEVLVNFDKRALRSTGRHDKLRPRFVGPYKILRRVGVDTYLLDLPRTSRVHPVFHAEYLQPYHTAEEREESQQTEEREQSSNESQIP